MRWIALRACIAAALTSYGCYSPKIGDCAQACGPNNSCGPGLTCDENQMCRIPANVGTACEGTDIDAPTEMMMPDAPIDVAIEDCTYELVSTSFEPSDVPALMPSEWNVMANTTFTTGGAGGRPIAQANGPDIWLVHHSRFTVAAGVTLTIKGVHPLIIAADEMDIKGTIVVENGANPSTCDAVRGQNVCDKAAGGGGGGYGARGGDGGGAPADNGGSVADIEPMPLRGGCNGAQGGDGRTGPGDVNARLGGLGGAGGGALQLTAPKRIVVEGEIHANGFAGKQGISDPAGGGACGITGRAAGGGGGGAGGTIFIESCEVIVRPTGKLCASGGGGGGGSGGGNSNTGQPGTDGRCDSAAPGGAGEIANSGGGVGGFNGNFAGGAGAIASRGGGGGGGAVGRIHLRQVSGPPQATGAAIRPPANRTE